MSDSTPLTKQGYPNQDLRSLSRYDLEQLMLELKQPKFRAGQIYDWIWKKNAHSFDDMSNLPKALREQLKDRLEIIKPEQIGLQISSDGSRKYLLQFDDKTAAECVGMPTQNHLTVCVSTQAGCAMGCAFCATGKLGLTRNLTAAEIYSQVMHVRDDFHRRVTHVVCMGQGEPLMNYDETIKALRMLNSPDGAGIGARHITVSTCGVIPHIQRFSKEPEQFTLAVSLHSAVQETRNMLMPGVKKFSLVHLYTAMGEYVDKTGRRPSYEYALIGGVNDTKAEMEALCDFCRGNLAHVNLIQLNEVPGSPFHPSTELRAQDFVRALAKVGVEATIRNSRGNDIAAACGQLQQMLKRV